MRLNTLNDFIVGDIVVVEPLQDDLFHEFSGHVTGFRDDFVQVTDGDGDTWDCLPEQVFHEN